MTGSAAIEVGSAATLVLAMSMFACSNADLRTLTVDFGQSSHGWVGDFADYPVGEDAFYQLETDYRALPAPLTESGQFITGNNHSDDLWMYYKGKVAGLSPDTRYSVTFHVELATNEPSGCVGVGGAPGEDVTVKAGGIGERTRPLRGGRFLANERRQRPAGERGEDAVVLGNVANSVPCDESPRWELKRVSGTGQAVDVDSDRTGAVWLFVGTDSAFEATTSPERRRTLYVR